MSDLFSSDKAKWLALAAGSAMIASFATRNLLRAGWRAFADNDPPFQTLDDDRRVYQFVDQTIALRNLLP